jgi:hypothetical protein
MTLFFYESVRKAHSQYIMTIACPGLALMTQEYISIPMGFGYKWTGKTIKTKFWQIFSFMCNALLQLTLMDLFKIASFQPELINFQKVDYTMFYK